MLFVSSGELTLAEHASSAGKQVKGGVEVRLINIDADAGKGLGVFENLHGVESPELFVQQLRNAAQRYYGTPIRAFLEMLGKGSPCSRTKNHVLYGKPSSARTCRRVPMGKSNELLTVLP